MSTFSPFLKTYYVQINSYLYEAFEEYDKTQDIKTLAIKIFGFSSKMTNKILLQRVLINEEDETFIDFPLAWKIHLFSHKLKFNRDLLFTAISSYVIEYKDDLYTYENLNIQTIKRLKQVYPEQRLLQLFFSSDFSLADDINKMLLTISKASENWKNYLPNKPKDLKILHDSLTISSTRLGGGDYDLNQRDDVLKLHSKVICGKYVLKVPKTHFDLVNLGQQLHFCIGNGNYSKEVLHKKISILSVYNQDTDKPLYGIEFNRYAIKQARGFDNSRVPDKVLAAIESLIISRPELPEDFIKMENHKFIDGYKYNNKDLFMLFSSGSIYVYENVTKEMYEAFEKVESKSLFFHSYIRKLAYLRIK